jgi:hypothetical protein
MFVTVLPAIPVALHPHERRDLVIEESRQVGKKLIAWYDLDVARYLFPCPTVLIWLMLLTLIVVPLVAFFLSYDALAGVRQRPLMRLLLPRVRPEGIALGAVLGRVCAFMIAIAAAHGVVWVVAIARGHDTAGAVLPWGCGLLCIIAVVTLANVALWVGVSSLFEGGRGALLGGLGLFLVLAAVHSMTHKHAVAWDGWTPLSLDGVLLSGKSATQWRGVLVALAWCLAGVGLSVARLRRRDA